MRYTSGTLICFIFALLFTWTAEVAGSQAGLSASGRFIKHGPSNSQVIVFVHGLYGDPDGTWRCDSQHYWPQMISEDADPAFATSDVYVLGYPTSVKHADMSIADLEPVIANRLEADRIFKDYKHVVFVAHSLGGILTQELLLTYRDRNYFNKVSFLYLYGTPQEGSRVASLGKLFDSDPLLKELSSDKGNFVLPDLDEKWKHAGFTSIKRYCAYERMGMHGFEIVSRTSATRNCDDDIAIAANHTQIVKPCSKEDDAYTALRNKMREVSASPPTEESSTLPPPSHAIPKVTWTKGAGMDHIDDPNAEVSRQKRLPVPAGRDVPVQIVTLKVDVDFYHPAFVVACEKACKIGRPFGNGMETLSFRDQPTISPNTWILIYDLPEIFAPFQSLGFSVSAADEKDINVVSVDPYLRP